MSNLLGRVVASHALRLTLVTWLAGMLSGIVFLGGSTIAQQTTVLSNTLKSQLVNVKAFLENNGVDTSCSIRKPVGARGFACAERGADPHPSSAGTMRPAAAAIFSQSLKLILGPSARS
jgi:hypothetical protein